MKKAILIILILFLAAIILMVTFNIQSFNSNDNWGSSYSKAQLTFQDNLSPVSKKNMPSFSASQEKVSLKLLLNENIKAKKLSFLNKVFAQENLGANFWTDGSTDITASLLYNDKKTASEDFALALNKESEGAFTVDIARSNEKFSPGIYHLDVKIEYDGQKKLISRDFAWGVLAINTNKSLYSPNETAYLQIAALSEFGHTICNAELMLEIIDPSGHIESFDSASGEIIRSGTCSGNNVTDNPDYYIYYKVGEVGKYQMKLTNTANSYEITDTFQVSQTTMFDVERTGATRINPFKSKYSMHLKVKANQDFAGYIVDSVPASFAINCEISNIKCTVESANSGTKNITWDTTIKKGMDITLEYEYQAPKISPELFLVGPLSIYGQTEGKTNESMFTEARNWQIASDATVTRESAAQANGSSSTPTFTKPSTLNNTDVLVVCFGIREDMAVTAVPTNWVLIDSNRQALASAYCYYKIITNAAGEPASYAWTISSTQSWAGGIVRYSGVDNDTPEDVTSANNGNPDAPPQPSVGGITTVTDNAMVVAFIAIDATTSTTIVLTAGDAVSQVWDTDTEIHNEYDDGRQASAGSTTSINWTLDLDRDWAAIEFALRPESGIISVLINGGVTIQGKTTIQ